MRIIFVTAIVFLLLLTLAGATEMDAAGSVGSIRKENSVRLYQFLFDGRVYGQLESKYLGHHEIGADRGYLFERKLQLDQSPYGGRYTIELSSSLLVDKKGWLVADSLVVAGEPEPLEMAVKVHEGALTGWYSRGNRTQGLDRRIGSKVFGWDDLLLDQHELFLSFHDLKPGDTISDTLYSPRRQDVVPVRVVVEGFTHVTYGRFSDSAFLCRFLEPEEQLVYYTRDRRVVKMLQSSRNIEAILIDNPIERLRRAARPFTIGDIGRTTPLYLFFLFTGILFSLPFGLKYRRSGHIYGAFLLGAGAGVLAYLIHQTLQTWYADTVFIPGLQSGGSLYYYSVWGSLITGVVHEAVKLIPLLLLWFLWRGKKSAPFLIIGLLIGAGFGVAEAGAALGESYRVGALKLLSWSSLERIFGILYHMAAGALLGAFLERQISRLPLAWLALVVVRTFTTFLALFVQKKVMDVAVYVFVTGLVDLLVVLAAYLILRKKEQKQKGNSPPLSS